MFIATNFWESRKVPSQVYRTILGPRRRSKGVDVYLPVEMKTWNIHPVFHVSRLRPYHPNDDTRFPGHNSVTPYDYGEPDDETGVESIDGHQWKGKSLKFHVKWVDGTDSWESWVNVEECTALDEYLVLQGVEDPCKLARRVTRA